jgi:hypothetical protein
MPERPRGWLLYPPFEDTDEWKPLRSPKEIRAAEQTLEAARRASYEAGIGGPGWRELWARILPLERELARLKGEEYAVELEVAAPMSPGAPQPTVISHEIPFPTSVVYFAADPGPGLVAPFDKTTHSMPMDRSKPQLIGVLKFIGVSEVLFGGPNDEALHKHRLSGRGLEPYSVHEVMNSRWAALTWDYRVPVGKPSSHRGRHFVVAFHDSLLEVSASNMVSRSERRTWHEVLAELATDTGPPPTVIRPDRVYRPPE